MKIPSLINNSAVGSSVIDGSKTIWSTSKCYHYKEEKVRFSTEFQKNQYYTEVEKVINNLTIVKACQKDYIPIKAIKMNKDIFAGFIAKYFNKCADKGVFPDDLKHADVTPIHKKKDKSDKTNYRPVIILLNTSKIYEKLIYNRLCDYFDDRKPPSQCDFRKGHSTQHYLLVMLENVENL